MNDELARVLAERTAERDAMREALASWVELARDGAFGADFMRDDECGCARTCEPQAGGGGDACIVCHTEEILIEVALTPAPASDPPSAPHPPE